MGNGRRPHEYPAPPGHCPSLKRADIDHHIDLGRAVFQGIPGSNTLTSVDVAPRGKPMTVQTLTSEYVKICTQFDIGGFTQTEAKWYLRASKHKHGRFVGGGVRFQHGMIDHPARFLSSGITANGGGDPFSAGADLMSALSKQVFTFNPPHVHDAGCAFRVLFRFFLFDYSPAGLLW